MKGQFDERPHSYRKEKVDNLIGVEEGIKELFFFAYERSHLVGKQRMKTHVLKAEFAVATQHLRLPVRPQRERRMPAPNGVLPKMRECFSGLQKTALNRLTTRRGDASLRRSHSGGETGVISVNAAHQAMRLDALGFNLMANAWRTLHLLSLDRNLLQPERHKWKHRRSSDTTRHE